MWHWLSAATSSSSGFQRSASPRKAGSEEPAIAAGRAVVVSHVRS